MEESWSKFHWTFEFYSPRVSYYHIIIIKHIAQLCEITLFRKIVGKTKIDRIRSQQIRESCGLRPINQWVERRREWDQNVTRMDTERLVKISKDNIPIGRRSQGRPKRRWSDLIVDWNREESPTKKKKKKDYFGSRNR